MLNNRNRNGLRHLPSARRWASFTTGVIRLPATRIDGGWASGWHDWYPWEILSFDAHGERATVRSLTDRRRTQTITTRQLEQFDELTPFGHVSRSGGTHWHRPTRRRKPRYV